MSPASLDDRADGVLIDGAEDGQRLDDPVPPMSVTGGAARARFGRLLASRPVAPIAAHLREPLYRNGYLLLINAGATSGLGLIFWALAAHAYSAEVVGINSAAIAAITLLTSLSKLELNFTLIRYIPLSGRATPRLIAGVYALVLALAALSGTLFVVAASLHILPVNFIGRGGIPPLLFVPLLVLWCLFNIQDSVLIGLRQVVWVPVENALFSLTKAGLLLALASALPTTGIFVAHAGTAAIATLPVNAFVFGWVLRRNGCRAQPREPYTLRDLVRYTAGEYGGTLAAMIAAGTPPLIVTAMLGAKAGAYFYIPWIISSAFGMLSANMSMSLTVEGVLDEGRLATLTREMLAHVLKLIAAVSLFLIVSAPLLLRLMGTAYVAHGTPLLRLLALAEIPNSVMVVYFGVARVQRRTREIAQTQAWVCVVFLSLLCALLPAYGIAGAGLAAVGSQSAAAVLLFFTRLRPLLWRQPAS
jgi:O-antigen/teichoic acid export membrane protein